MSMIPDSNSCLNSFDIAVPSNSTEQYKSIGILSLAVAICGMLRFEILVVPKLLSDISVLESLAWFYRAVVGREVVAAYRLMAWYLRLVFHATCIVHTVSTSSIDAGAVIFTFQQGFL